MIFDTNFVDVEGIANALNEGIKDFEQYDYIGFLANDIIEPDNWLLNKALALNTYPNAGIVASSLDNEKTSIVNDYIISNWLIATSLISKIGKFNESFYPYGPIDLDYCERAWIAGFNTYYVMNCLAQHTGGNALPNEYGWDKTELVAKYWKQYEDDKIAYKDRTKNIKL
jgi:GT2 family glycosyltransferase